MTRDQAIDIVIKLLTPYMGKSTFYKTGADSGEVLDDADLNSIPTQPLFDTFVKNDKANNTHFFEDFIRQYIFICHDQGYTLSVNTNDFIDGTVGTVGDLIEATLTNTMRSKKL